MCGINGIIGSNSEKIDQMVATTSHRGPDATGFYINDGVALGHNRLSILDLDTRSNQPFISADGRYVLVFNGEIYNYRELKRTLNSYKFITNSDTEVLLALLSREGKSCLSKLNGIFSFAFWDTAQKTVLLARDQMGIKPLYYSFAGTTLSFSSELSALLGDTGKRKLSQNALQSYFQLGYTVPTHSIIEGINKLPAGHTLEYRSGDQEIQIGCFYERAEGDISNISNQVIHDTIKSAVSRQLVSDRPVGLTLSGGIDSSIILHHVQSVKPDIQTFSASFQETKHIDEKFNHDAVLAAQTARHYGVAHKVLEIPALGICDNLEEILSQQIEPIANPTSVARNLLYKMIRDEGIVVVLGGDGGDELFGGYGRYQRVLAAQYFQKLPHWMQMMVISMYGRAKSLQLPLHQTLHIRLVSQPSSIYKPIFNSTNVLDTQYLSSGFASLYEKHKKITDPVSRFMQVDRETWLCEESLLQTDGNSMRHGIEARVPLLDIDVVALSDCMATASKLDLRHTKKQLREVYRQHLPPYLFNQPKRGWQSPGAKWLRDEQIEPFVREVFSGAYYDGLSTLIDWSAVQHMYTKHIEGDYHLYPLWHLLQLQIWTRHHGVRYD